ncbi:MAG: hypothetical protein V3S50_02605, partial [Acidobacteriota bacterium]
VLNFYALRFLGCEFSQAPATAAKRLRACLRMNFLEHEKLNIETFVTFWTGNPSNFCHSKILNSIK